MQINNQKISFGKSWNIVPANNQDEVIPKN